MFITFSTPLKIRHEKVLHDLIQTAQLHNLNLAVHSFLKAYHIVFFFNPFFISEKLKFSYSVESPHMKMHLCDIQEKLLTEKSFYSFPLLEEGEFLTFLLIIQNLSILLKAVSNEN